MTDAAAPESAPAPGSLEFLADADPDAMAITDGERSLTRGDWERRASALARGLATEYGIGAGSRVAVKTYNRAEYFEITFALAKLGATPVAVGFKLAPAEVRHILDDSGAALLVTDDGALDGLHLGDEYEALLRRHTEGRRPLSEASPAAASIVYTSGTTGRPKGAVREFDAEKMAALGETIGDMLGRLRFAPGGVHLMVCPNYHAAPPFYANFTLAFGGRVVIQPRFDPEGALALIAAERVTSTFMVPTMLHRIAALPPHVREQYDISSLRAVISGDAPFPATLKRPVIDALGDDVLFDMYGSTETGNVTLLEPADHERKPGSVGRPLRGVEVRILDPDGAPVAAGERGEVYIASPMTVSGYHGNPEATAASLRDGFFTVGDIGYLDDDGYLYIVDRIKDTIIAGGVDI
ncbi:class I adenylate-forming enzyme family protein [Mycobacterium sp. ML4]